MSRKTRTRKACGLHIVPAPTAGELELLAMLKYKRPCYSASEAAFVARFIHPTGATPDAFGNYWLTIGDSPILWSCHTDTVHATGGFQRLEYGDGYVTAPGSDCLGADCTTGVWIMVNMIRAGIPGTYVFHRAEERGGRGSSFIRTTTPDRLQNFLYAIAFDRQGAGDVITHQFYRTASYTFAQSVANILAPMAYSPSDGGTFTDTATYADVIPECSNLSIGYYNQHRPSEYQDVEHATALLASILAGDWTKLVCSRDPTTDDEPTQDDEPWSNAPQGEDNHTSRPRDLEEFCYHNPLGVADFLSAQGFTLEDLEDHCGPA